MSLEPAIPYIDIHPPFTIPANYFSDGVPPKDWGFPQPFGLLVAIGTYLGAWLTMRHGRRRGLSDKALLNFILWVAAVGFIGGHVFDVLFYFPEKLVENPLRLLAINDGLSSFGGFLGAIIGAFIWQHRNRTSMLPYADMCASTFPLGWVFGRMGCASVHDHPGARSDLWIAVQYPDGGRFDLGLYEMLLTVPLAIWFLSNHRREHPWGFYLGWFATLYAPVRFLLDFLRATDLEVVDARYGPFTPAQWLSFGLLGVGLWLLKGVRAGRDDSDAALAPEPPDRFVLPAPPEQTGMKTAAAKSARARVEDPDAEEPEVASPSPKRRKKKKKKKRGAG